VSDITARKEMEEELRQSEDQFRTLADAIPQLCGMADPEGNFIWYNRRWYEYTGTTLEQTKGWDWQSTLDPEVVPEALERAHHSVATGEPFQMVLPLRGADGVVRPYLTRSTPLRDRDGRVVRWFATATDISEQRKTEDALRKAHSEELARATELQVIMDEVPVAIFISRDPECRNIIGNRSAYQLFRELQGSNLSKSVPDGKKLPAVRVMKDGREIPPRELPVQKAAATGQAVYDLELELAFEDVSRGNIIGNAVPFLDAEGRSPGLRRRVR
jgi:PAS domain S-box-containing protein